MRINGIVRNTANNIGFAGNKFEKLEKLPFQEQVLEKLKKHNYEILCDMLSVKHETKEAVLVELLKEKGFVSLRKSLGLIEKASGWQLSNKLNERVVEAWRSLLGVRDSGVATKKYISEMEKNNAALCKSLGLSPNATQREIDEKLKQRLVAMLCENLGLKI